MDDHNSMIKYLIRFFSNVRNRNGFLEWTAKNAPIVLYTLHEWILEYNMNPIPFKSRPIPLKQSNQPFPQGPRHQQLPSQNPLHPPFKQPQQPQQPLQQQHLQQPLQQQQHLQQPLQQQQIHHHVPQRPESKQQKLAPYTRRLHERSRFPKI